MTSTCCDAFETFHAVIATIATTASTAPTCAARLTSPRRGRSGRESKHNPGEHDRTRDEHEPQPVPTEDREQQADRAERGDRRRDHERQDPNPLRVVVLVQRSVPIGRAPGSKR